MVYVGSVIGFLLFPFIADNYGRKINNWQYNGSYICRLNCIYSWRFRMEALCFHSIFICYEVIFMLALGNGLYIY